ncbi:MAG: ABC transporter ATP-binding protein [Anaerolineae bacterium]|nr:ABC transporter ATP-binding protein [Anaerolineae bacterium]
MTQDTPLLDIRSLSVSFPRFNQRVRVLDRVSFSVGRGAFVGLVGESGSGKTLSSLTAMGFLPPSARVDGGEVWLNGQNLLALSPEEMSKVRGRKIAMIFQSTRSALNPMMRAGDQVARAIRIQKGVSGKEAYAEAVQLLKQVGIADAEKRARAYPHQLSGGMCQRVLVAMMLACRPSLLIADEPTTGLDVTIQAQIFEMIREVQRETGASILLITHDLGVVAETCQRVVVMYAGQIMESASVASLFAKPMHPYTRMLMGSVLRVDRRVEPPQAASVMKEEITYGIVGCRFAPRCPVALPVCWEQKPEPEIVENDHQVACHNWRGMNGTGHSG